jgi:predicted DNA-binding protein (MmcQ/YjbR family)
MDIETIRNICKDLPHVTEDVKWEHDLVFSIGLKMFCVTGLDETPVSASFKVTDEEFEEMSNRPGFKPAPYLARYKWVLLEDISLLKKSELEARIRQSYELVKAKLPAKTRKDLDNN